MQAPIAFSWINRAALLAVALTIAMGGGPVNLALATTSTTTLTQANQSRLSSEAEQLAAQGRYSEAAGRFEALAAQTSNADRDRYLLKAARNAQLAGDDNKTQTLLSLLGKNLSAADAAQRTVINATQALRQNQADRAIAQLDQIPLPLPAGVAPDILAVRVQALFALGRTALAVSTAVERERELRSETEISRNRQVIWDGLKQAANAGRDLTPPAGANRITTGWLELASLSSSNARDPFAMNRGLADWRARYPGHPGSTIIGAPNTAVATIRPTSERIALLLPLSGRQQAAGIAVRDGFFAAALQGRPGPRNDIQVFDTNQSGTVDAYQRAMQAGAGIVVGPLLKEDVDALAKTQQVGVMTLALNALSDGQTPPGLMFQFALDPEEEARQVAQRASREGFTRAILLAPNNEWGLRVQRAFAAELAAQGGTLVDQRYYDPAARDHVGLSKQLFESRKPRETQILDDTLGKKPPLIEARDDFDYIFMAAQAAQAKQLRPALRFVLPDTSIPIYATSDSYEPESANNDLDGLRFVDMPWVINRDPEIAALYDNLSRLWGSNLRSRSRLYAFGIDAYHLVNWLKTPQPQLASPLHGATGLLALDQSGRVRRQSDWAQIVNGKPQALPDVIGTTLR